MSGKSKEAQLAGFLRAANSLRLANRAELVSDDRKSIVKDLYVDPSPSGDCLDLLLQPETTLVVGSKGTGKSTLFQRLQHELRSSKDAISAYIDIRTVFSRARLDEVAASANRVALADPRISVELAQQVSLAHEFIKLTVKTIVDELRLRVEERGLLAIWQTITGSKRKAIDELEGLLDPNKYLLPLSADQVRSGQRSVTDFKGKVGGHGGAGAFNVSREPGITAGLRAGSIELSGGMSASREVEAYLRRFNFPAFVDSLKLVLARLGIKRLYVIVDDYSELPGSAMRLFVRDIFEPLNDASDDLVKFKIAAYPGRVYFGQVDVSKIGHIHLDPYRLYANDPRGSQFMESQAIKFVQNLVNVRMEHYCGVNAEAWFEADTEAKAKEIWVELYHATFANPRTLGNLLFTLYRERLSGGKRGITAGAVRDAAKRVYAEKVEPFFFSSREADLAFEEEQSRPMLREFVQTLIGHADVMRRRQEGTKPWREMREALAGAAPTSHFRVRRELEPAFRSLELNQFVTKYAERTEDGHETTVFALNRGLCWREGVVFSSPWDTGGRGISGYGQFLGSSELEWTKLVEDFLTRATSYKCDNCGHEEGPEGLVHLARYHMLCPECKTGIMEALSRLQPRSAGPGDQSILSGREVALLGLLVDFAEELPEADVAIELDCTPEESARAADLLAAKGLIGSRTLAGAVVHAATEAGKQVFHGLSDRRRVRIE